jgi:hypothetical protein
MRHPARQRPPTPPASDATTPAPGILLLAGDLEIRIIDAATGELLREFPGGRLSPHRNV